MLTVIHNADRNSDSTKLPDKQLSPFQKFDSLAEWRPTALLPGTNRKLPGTTVKRPLLGARLGADRHVIAPGTRRVTRHRVRVTWHQWISGHGDFGLCGG